MESDLNPETQDQPQDASITRRIPALYATLSAGKQSPELLRAESDEEALSIVQGRVKAGQLQAVYVYKLIGAELFEPSSVSMSVDDVLKGLSLPPRN